MKKNGRARTVVPFLLVVPLLIGLVGCGQEEVSQSSVESAESISNSNESASDYTPSSSCRFDSAVESMKQRLRSASYMEIEEAKILYLDANSDPDCAGSAQSLKAMLRPVWQQYINQRTTESYLGCNNGCIQSSAFASLAGGDSDSSGCQAKCAQERAETFSNNSQSLSSFFR